MCPGMNIHSSTWCVTRCHLWPTATSYHPIATTFLWLLTWFDQLPDVTCDQLWPEKSIDQFYCYHKCDNILSLTCCDKLMCDQMWPETRLDLWPGVTCDQLWPVTTHVTIFFPWFVAINCYMWPDVTSYQALYDLTRCDQGPGVTRYQVWPDVTSYLVLLFLPATATLLWPGVTSDQVWPVTRFDQHPVVTCPFCHYYGFVTSCQLPGHTWSHLVYWRF